MIDEAAEYKIQNLLGNAIHTKWAADFSADDRIEVDPVDFNKIVVQLRALGLVALSETKRGVRDKGTTFWSLTPYGSEYMNRLVAIPRPDVGTAVSGS